MPCAHPKLWIQAPQMKVCMLTTDYLPNIGGIAAHVHNLSAALAELGHDVVVVNPVAQDDETIEQSRVEGFSIFRVGVKRSAWTFRNKVCRKFLFSKAALKGIAAAEEQFGRFDVIHQHDYQDTTYAAAKRADSSTWIWTNHSSRFLSDFERPFKMKFIRKTYSRVSGAIAVSDELLQKTKSLLPNHAITYIPNGVNTKLFHDGVAVNRADFSLDDQDLVVLCPRRMVRKNGVIYLAQAVDQVLKTAPDISWKFVFLGNTEAVNTDREYIREIKNLLEPFEKTGHVIYLGNIPMEQMPRVNALTDIVMMPSLMEAVSLSALEGMASRKALVVSEVGGLPEIVKHEQTGLLVPPKNPDAIAKALVRLGQAPELRHRLALAGQVLAQNQYSWLAVAERTANFYQQVSQRRSIKAG